MLTEKRRGEIALALVRYEIRKQGIPGHYRVNEIRRELVNLAKRLEDVSPEELEQFAEEEIRMAVNELFENL